MTTKYSSITQSDRDFYTRSIDKYLSYLLEPEYTEIKNNKFKVKIDYKMRIEEFQIKSLSEAENKEFKEFLEQLLLNIFKNLNFEDPDQLGLTLGDYIDYVLEN